MGVFSKPAGVAAADRHSPTKSKRSSKRRKDPPGALAKLRPGGRHSNTSSSNGSVHSGSVVSQKTNYQTTHISKHYALNHQIYEAFKKRYYNLKNVVDTQPKGSNRRQTDVERARSNFEWISGAFSLGLYFCETALLELPNHGYFYSNEDPATVKLRQRSATGALEVTRLLYRIVKLVESVAVLAPPKATSGGDPNARLLLEPHRAECKRKLTQLKFLAKEQCDEDALQDYESKRLTVIHSWKLDGVAAHQPDSSYPTSPNPAEEDNDDGNSVDSAMAARHKKAIDVMLGNHRGKGTTSAAASASSSSTSHTAPTTVVDCNVGESLLSCTQYLCPVGIPTEDDSARQASPPPSSSPRRWEAPKVVQPSSQLPQSSLADQATTDDNVTTDDARSDLAVLEESGSSSYAASSAVPRQQQQANTSVASDRVVPAAGSDDAVFQEPPLPSPPSAAASLASKGTASSAVSKAQATKGVANAMAAIARKEEPPSSPPPKKKTPNSSLSKTNDVKKSRSYTRRLFSKKTKKSNSGSNPQKAREDAELREALFQSELEAAKAASIRDNESASIGDWSGSWTSSIGATSHDEGNFAPDGSEGHDYDLQRALYLSGLEVTQPDGTVWNPQEVPSEQQQQPPSQPLPQERSFDDQVEDRRDDSGGAGRSVPDRSTVVVQGIPVASPYHHHHATAAATHAAFSNPLNSFATLRECCRKDFHRLVDQGSISVTRVPTYQGRVRDSTNGCTVIAPLLCVHHFRNGHMNPDDGASASHASNASLPPSTRISDATVVSVIDAETPSLLPSIRKSLGVSKNAFLIPHDAHEALIESKHMSRDQFVTVCGGNILDCEGEESHLGVLIEELSRVLPDGKKLGATFFFHQHVIAILQIRQDTDSTAPETDTEESSTKPAAALAFDVIDSLPNKATFPPQRPSSPLSVVTGSTGTPDCARIFCRDAPSLRAFFKWYACSVFTSENERYIDAYEWDEKMTDFDPRVFQAFLWKEV